MNLTPSIDRRNVRGHVLIGLCALAAVVALGIDMFTPNAADRAAMTQPFTGSEAARPVHLGGKDVFRWYVAAQRVLAGKPLIDPGLLFHNGAWEVPDKEYKFYRLPPAFAVYVSPLGLLGPGSYAMGWYLFSILCALGSILLAMKTASGRWLPAQAALLALPFFGAGRFILDDLFCGNTSMQLLILLMLGAYFIQRKLNWAGGLAIGLAVAMKAYPAAILLPLLACRRWSAAGWVVLGAAVFSLPVPGLVRGQERQWQETKAWYARIIGPYAQNQQVREWQDKDLSQKNQSLDALLQRLLRPVDIDNSAIVPDGSPNTMNIASLSPGLVRAILIALLAAAAGGILWAARGKIAGGADTAAADLAIGMSFILLASPIVWDYFYCLLLLPMALAAREGLCGPPGAARSRRWLAAAWAATFLLIVISFLPECSLGIVSRLCNWARGFGVLVVLGALWFVIALILRRRAGGPAGQLPIAEGSAQ